MTVLRVCGKMGVDDAIGDVALSGPIKPRFP